MWSLDTWMAARLRAFQRFWLIRHNAIRNRAKRASRQMLESHVPVDDVTLAGTEKQRLLEARDMLQRVEAAVLRLRPKTRQIFMAHRVEGLSDRTKSRSGREVLQPSSGRLRNVGCWRAQGIADRHPICRISTTRTRS